MSNQKRPIVVEIVLIALFAALNFVALFLKVPIADQFLHVGNATCILAALLLGGWQGGLAGSIGMGLNDLFFYPSSVLKTVILKFGIGLFTGLLFSYGRRHPEKSANAGVGIAAGVSLLAGGALALLYASDPEAYGKAWIAFGFLLVLGATLLVLLAVSLMTKKPSHELLFAGIGATVGIAFNVAGEFIWKTVENLLLGLSPDAAVTATLIKIPATFINGSFSVILALVVYAPIRAALKKARLDQYLA